MANYYLPGYSTPEGVSSREEVRAYQRMLGVTADGIWGPVTQAAYDRSAAGTESPSLWESDAFKGYYQTILGAISPPGIAVNVPSRESLAEDYKTILRPNVDLAIEHRRARGEETRAEIDADAASRGMAASTYVSSMKEREGDDTEDDVSMMEAQYTSTLAERIASALEYYTSLEMQAANTNAQMAASARNTAVGIAAQWYQNDLTSSVPAKQTTGGGTESNRLTRQDYLEYVSLLTANEREALFHSDAGYWKEQRSELVAGLGKKGYEALVKSYQSAFGGTGGSAWMMTAR